MERKEFNKIATSIAGHYVKDKLSSNQEDYWYETLKPFDYEDVNKRFESHLKSEYSHTLPSLNYLYKGLKTSATKGMKGVKKVLCRICGKEHDAELEWTSWEKCEERCGRIRYIKRQVEKFGLKLESNIDNMGLPEIDQVYYKIIKHIKNKIDDVQQVNAINKILETI